MSQASTDALLSSVRDAIFTHMHGSAYGSTGPDSHSHSTNFSSDGKWVSNQDRQDTETIPNIATIENELIALIFGSRSDKTSTHILILYNGCLAPARCILLLCNCYFTEPIRLVARIHNGTPPLKSHLDTCVVLFNRRLQVGQKRLSRIMNCSKRHLYLHMVDVSVHIVPLRVMWPPRLDVYR
jgi:hypothetical protein